MMLRLLVIAALAALVLVPAGTAAEPALDEPVSSPPMKPQPDPRRSTVLRTGGLAVTWPLRGARVTLSTGERIAVRVRQEGDAPRAARISLVRIGPRGRALETIARARLRDGTFAVRIPDRNGVRYRLQVAIGAWTHSTVVRAAVDCMGALRRGRVAATLRLDRGSARAGETLSATLANTGSVCLVTGLAYGWERRVGDVWETVEPPDLLAFPEIALVLAPGTDQAHDVQVWDDMGAGTYRLVKDVNGQVRRPVSRTIASGRLTVLAP